MMGRPGVVLAECRERGRVDPALELLDELVEELLRRARPGKVSMYSVPGLVKIPQPTSVVPVPGRGLFARRIDVRNGEIRGIEWRLPAVDMVSVYVVRGRIVAKATLDNVFGLHGCAAPIPLSARYWRMRRTVFEFVERVLWRSEKVCVDLGL